LENQLRAITPELMAGSTPNFNHRYIYLLGIFYGSVTKGPAGHRYCPRDLRLSRHTDMTIHWKALDEHFPSLIQPFSGNMHFLNFSQKTSVLKELMLDFQFLNNSNNAYNNS
jgi:hypothetical protein